MKKKKIALFGLKKTNGNGSRTVSFRLFGSLSQLHSSAHHQKISFKKHSLSSQNTLKTFHNY